MKDHSITKRLHSFPESAEELNVSLPTLWRAAAAKTLKTVRIGSRRLISDDELRRVAREGLSTSAKTLDND
jgi:excisionase family DNA binding protein